MIQRMLAIWSLVPLPFLNPAWTSGTRTSGSNRPAINQRFPQPPFLGFNSSSRVAQRIQETHTLTISAIYHKGRVRVRIDSQMKRCMQRGSGGASVLWKLGMGRVACRSFLVPQPECSLKSLLSGFYGGSNTRAQLIKPSATGDRFDLQPLPPPHKSGGGTESSNPSFMVGSLTTCPHT